MYVKRKRRRRGHQRGRTYQRLAQEAGMDYLVSMLRLPGHTRERYAKRLGSRGFDISSQDMRRQPAPKPHFPQHASDEVRGPALGHRDR